MSVVSWMVKVARNFGCRGSRGGGEKRIAQSINPLSPITLCTEETFWETGLAVTTKRLEFGTNGQSGEERKSGNIARLPIGKMRIVSLLQLVDLTGTFWN